MASLVGAQSPPHALPAWQGRNPHRLPPESMLVLKLVSDVSQGRIMNPWLICLQFDIILEPVLEPPDLCILVSRTHYYNIVSEVY